METIQEATARIDKILNESSVFIAKCKSNMLMTRELQNHAQRKCEELMILKEESIAIKSESIELIKTSAQGALEDSMIWRGVKDDISVVRHMLEEIRQDFISDERPNLLSLRGDLLNLSFLPT